MITIDQLRKMGGSIKREGQGVIKYRLRQEAYHFYDGTIHKVRNTGIHQHFFSFTSSIIKGELKTRMYVISGTDPNSIFQLVRKKHKSDRHFSVELDNITIAESCSFSTVAGRSYYLQYTGFHKIEMMEDKVVTHLRHTGPYEQPTIGYLKDTTMPEADYLPAIPEKECWEIAADILT